MFGDDESEFCVLADAGQRVAGERPCRPRVLAADDQEIPGARAVRARGLRSISMASSRDNSNPALYNNDM